MVHCHPVEMAPCPHCGYVFGSAPKYIGKSFPAVVVAPGADGAPFLCRACGGFIWHSAEGWWGVQTDAEKPGYGYVPYTLLTPLEEEK